MLAERLGSRAGGLVANLPSNVLVALLFVGLAQGPEYAAEAALAVPPGMAVDSVFLLVLVLALGRARLPLALAAALGVWAALAWAAQRTGYTEPAGTVLAYAVVTLAAFAWLERRPDLRAQPGRPQRYRPGQLAARAVLAGGVVAGTVVLSSFAGPYWVGLFAAFPAVLSSTLALLALSRGPAFAQATGKVLVLSSSNIVVYGMAVHLAYPALGLVLGTALAYAAAALWVAALRPVLRRVAT